MTEPIATPTAAKRSRAPAKRVGSRSATVADYISDSLSNPLKPPPPSPRKPRQPGRKAGIWDTMSPEERSAHAKRLAALRNPSNMARTKRRNGTPSGWNHEAVAVAKSAARLEAVVMVGKLKTQGLVARDNPEAEAELIEALTTLRAPGGDRRRVKIARRLLNQFHPDLAGLV